MAWRIDHFELSFGFLTKQVYLLNHSDKNEFQLQVTLQVHFLVSQRPLHNEERAWAESCLGY